jgi:hypothetical protein
MSANGVPGRSGVRASPDRSAEIGKISRNGPGADLAAQPETWSPAQPLMNSASDELSL